MREDFVVVNVHGWANVEVTEVTPFPEGAVHISLEFQKEFGQDPITMGSWTVQPTMAALKAGSLPFVIAATEAERFAIFAAILRLVSKVRASREKKAFWR